MEIIVGSVGVDCGVDCGVMLGEALSLVTIPCVRSLLLEWLETDVLGVIPTEI